MAKRIKGGAKTVGGKCIIGLYITEELKKTIENAAKELGITRQAFIILAVNKALDRDDKEIIRHETDEKPNNETATEVKDKATDTKPPNEDSAFPYWLALFMLASSQWVDFSKCEPEKDLKYYAELYEHLRSAK